MVNILAIYLSLARLNASNGKAEYPVFAARTRINAVVPCMKKYMKFLPNVSDAICETTVSSTFGDIPK
jgi:hypothetical protein